MSTEFVFTVQPGAALSAEPISLAEAGLRERDDLQEWVRLNPHILGPGVRIVTFEFGRWQARDGYAADRLDLLGLDPDGRLVVAELKRGPAPDVVEMQAIKYAALATNRADGGELPPAGHGERRLADRDGHRGVRARRRQEAAAAGPDSSAHT